MGRRNDGMGIVNHFFQGAWEKMGTEVEEGDDELEDYDDEEEEKKVPEKWGVQR